ncbi:MAG: sugar kinase, partial [Oscillospiraceae bacterium]
MFSLKQSGFDLISFGEIMLRLSPPMNERIVRGDVFEKRAGGSELNVASGVSLLGLRTGIISKLPANEMGTFIKNRIRFCGVSDDYLVYDETPDARLGIYYYESGAAPRKPAIVYDRKGSSVGKISIDEIPDEVFSNTRCFHTSGISLALSPSVKEFTIELIKKFKKAGAMISFDVNYRANLWGENEARETLKDVFKYVDVLFISEET